MNNKKNWVFIFCFTLTKISAAETKTNFRQRTLGINTFFHFILLSMMPYEQLLGKRFRIDEDEALRKENEEMKLMIQKLKDDVLMRDRRIEQLQQRYKRKTKHMLDAAVAADVNEKLVEDLEERIQLVEARSMTYRQALDYTYGYITSYEQSVYRLVDNTKLNGLFDELSDYLIEVLHPEEEERRETKKWFMNILNK